MNNIEANRVLKSLLREAGMETVLGELVNIVDHENTKNPERYLGMLLWNLQDTLKHYKNRNL